MLKNYTKLCTNCQKTKNFSEFFRDKSHKDGFSSWCKPCKNLQMQEFFRTKDGLIAKIYSSQRGNSKQRKHNPPTYTKQELKEWLFNQDLFHELFDKWVDSGYLKDLIPSVDRKKDDIEYTMDNIQLLTWVENEQKHNNDIRSAESKHGNKPQKAVIQYDKQKNEIARFVSTMEAYRKTGVNQGDISSCCLSKLKSAGGFIWEYQNG